MKKFFLFSVIAISTFISHSAFAEVTVNSGFIPGQIWYSKEQLVEGDTVNIYTAIWNGEKESISAKIEFYDKNVILGSREVSISPLELKDVNIPWKVTAGDHAISAKTVSSTAILSGKKENVILNLTTTTSDKQFVSVLIKNADGVKLSEADVIKNQLDKTSNDIGNIIPDNVSAPLTSGLGVIEDLRSNTLVKVDTAIDATKNELGKVLGVSTQNKNLDKSNIKTPTIQDSTNKPIAYVKLFLLSTLSFILGSRIVFYSLIAIILFFVFRGIYRKIRNR